MGLLDKLFEKQKNKKAYERKVIIREWMEKLAEYEVKAEQGDLEHQKLIANICERGILDEKREFTLCIDKEKSFKWCKRAADQGDPDAQLWLGEKYLKGSGTKKDIKKAIKLFKELASKDEESAYRKLARIYHSGDKGVPVNYSEAAKWFQKTVDARGGNFDDEAKYELAVLYLEGKGVKKNIKKAKILLEEGIINNTISGEQWKCNARIVLDKHNLK